MVEVDEEGGPEGRLDQKPVRRLTMIHILDTTFFNKQLYTKMDIGNPQWRI